mgnify:CR=1 FL=1|tara:strand:+ start:1587 stop:2144 length:558 start_codon:yes stop_codon:yes gene_type:complete
MNNNSEDSLIEGNDNNIKNNDDIDSYQDNDDVNTIIEEDVSNSDVDEEDKTDQDNENNDDAETIIEEDDSDDSDDDDIINDKIIDDEDDFKVVSFKETINNMYKNKDKKKTIPVLTKYEKARVLGYRAKQIECGAKPFIDPGDMINSIDIAKKELYSKKLPFIIRRPLPDGTFEDWPIQELIITV